MAFTLLAFTAVRKNIECCDHVVVIEPHPDPNGSAATHRDATIPVLARLRFLAVQANLGCAGESCRHFHSPANPSGEDLAQPSVKPSDSEVERQRAEQTKDCASTHVPDNFCPLVGSWLQVRSRDRQISTVGTMIAAFFSMLTMYLISDKSRQSELVQARLVRFACRRAK